MSLAEQRRLRLFTLCALYVAQGIPWGFTAMTIPAYLAEQGVDRATIGVALATTTLPYTFKWVWGPIIDAFTIPRLGRRRPWILFAQVMMAGSLIAMLAIPDISVDLKLLARMILIHTLFSGLQDVAVDALGVDLLDDDERGRANGLMYASKYAGGIVGAFGMSKIITWYGFEASLIVQCVILFAIMLLPLLVRERATEPIARPKLRDVMRGLAQVFSVRSAFVTAVLMLGVNLATGVLTANAASFYVSIGWTRDEYLQLGSIALFAGFVGASIAAFVSERLGRRRFIAVAATCMATGWLVFGLMKSSWADERFVYTFAIAEVLFQSMTTAGLFALCMDVAWAPVAASQFTAYMSLANFSTTLGYVLVGHLPASFDFQTCFIAAAIVQVTVMLLLFAIDPTETRRTLPRPAGAKIPIPGLIAAAALGVILVRLTVYVVRLYV